MKNIDNEFIEAFYTQYWGQRVGIRNDTEQRYKVNVSTIYELKSIELRSIDSLTDEEYVKIAQIVFNEEGRHTTEKGKKFIKRITGVEQSEYMHQFLTFERVSKLIDHLRSIGMAVPFQGFSVEKMIESGKLKLKQ